jgi:hypothetical protein
MEIDNSKETIAVWFSCGAASAVATYLTVEKYRETHNILVLNNPIDEEDEDNLRFKKDIEEWIGIKIIESINTEQNTTSAEVIWKRRKFMANNQGAPCTMLLKKGARHEAELKYKIDWHVLGFTKEEEHRHKRFTTFERKNVIPILIENVFSKSDCFNFILNAGIKLPRVYEFLDNANCIGCVKSSGIDYWQRVRKHYPEIFEKRAVLSRELKCKLVKYNGKRIYLDELPLDAKGRKGSRPECSIFCQLPNHKKRVN